MKEKETPRERSIYEITSSNRQPKKLPQVLSRHARKSEADLYIEDTRTDLILRRRSAYFTYSLVGLNTAVTFTILFLCGFGLMALSNKVLLSLIGQSLAHVSTVFVTMNRYLFPPKR